MVMASLIAGNHDACNITLVPYCQVVTILHQLCLDKSWTGVLGEDVRTVHPVMFVVH